MSKDRTGRNNSFFRNNLGWKIVVVLVAVASFFARDAYTRLLDRQTQIEVKHDVTREIVNSHDTDIGIIRTQMTHWTEAVNENTKVLRELRETIVELRLELERRGP